MLMYGWMKWVELAPQRYDWAVTLLTGGRVNHIKDKIAEKINSGDRVLDIGCGTGTLALRFLKKGARVDGLDSSRAMLEKAGALAAAAGLDRQLRLVHDSITRLPVRFPDQQFDVITATLALGEFSAEYRNFILRDCHLLLRPGGRLIIADEIYPENPFARFIYFSLMIGFWIPQFLILRRVIFPIKGLSASVVESGFAILSSKTWPINSLQLLCAEKPFDHSPDLRVD